MAVYEEFRITRFPEFYTLALRALPHMRQQRSEQLSE